MLRSAQPSEPGTAAVARLATSVQDNCDLADAQHARELGMCIYLLGMREYFRWVSDYPLGAVPPTDRVRDWIACQETRWDAISDRMDGFADLPIPDGPTVAAFDEAEVNRRIAGMGLPERLLYGAGLGRFGIPVFFLAEPVHEEFRDGVRVTVVDREWARGFTAPPATSRSGSIQIRRDAFRRWLWTRAEQHGLHGGGGSFQLVLDAYAGHGSAAPGDRLIERIVLGETETLILHELGEVRAAQALGSDWERMLAQITDRRTEIMLRAVRDLLADCLVTLPVLADRGAAASLAFWHSHFEGMRKTLAPEMSIFFDAARGIDIAGIREAASAGASAWEELARDLLAQWRRGGSAAVAAAVRQFEAQSAS